MVNLIGAVIGAGLVSTFLIYMAVGIGSIPLGIIIAGALLMAWTDVVEALRKGQNGGSGGE